MPLHRKIAATPEEYAQVFWSRVEIKGPDVCWIYNKNPHSYGNFCGVPTNRYSYLLARGFIPAGLFVCHTCDVRGCVNPRHLVAQTRLWNVRDMLAKGRGNQWYQRKKSL